MTSLSQQLKLGKIHQKVKPGKTSSEDKESPEVKKRSYTDYLQGEKKSTRKSSEKGKHIRITPPTGKTPDVKIIKSRSKHRNRKPKKKQGPDPLKEVHEVLVGVLGENIVEPISVTTIVDIMNLIGK